MVQGYQVKMVWTPVLFEDNDAETSLPNYRVPIKTRTGFGGVLHTAEMNAAHPSRIAGRWRQCEVLKDRASRWVLA